MSLSDLAAISAEIALVAGTMATLLVALFVPQRRQRAAAASALATLAVSGALLATVVAMHTPATLMGGTYLVDIPALALKAIVLASAALAVLVSLEWFAGDAREGEYYALLLFAAAGMFALASAGDLMEVVVGLLLTSIASYVLVAWERSSGRATEAAMKYFLFGALTNVTLLYGFALLYGLGGETTFAELGPALDGASRPALALGAGLVVVGLAFKIGAVPVHFWTPDVFHGGPAPVIAYLSAAPKAAALLALARFLDILPAELDWRPALAAVSAASILLGTLGMFRQESVKRLLAYSSIAQVGFILMAIVALGRSDLALPGLLYYLAAYLAMNVGAFAVVVELRGLDERERWSGLWRAQPWLAAAMVLFLLSLVGIPPLAGFVGKFTVFAAAIDAGYGWLVGIAAAATVASLYPYLRLIAPMTVTPQPEAALRNVAGRAAAVAVAACAVATVALGLAAEPLIRAFERVRLLP